MTIVKKAPDYFLANCYTDKGIFLNCIYIYASYEERYVIPAENIGVDDHKIRVVKEGAFHVIEKLDYLKNIFSKASERQNAEDGYRRQSESYVKGLEAIRGQVAEAEKSHANGTLSKTQVKKIKVKAQNEEREYLMANTKPIRPRSIARASQGDARINLALTAMNLVMRGRSR